MIAPVLWAILLVALGVWLGHGIWPRSTDAQVREEVVMSLLKSQRLNFLVTRRAATQLVLEHTESSWTGEWHAVLWCTITWRWGVDLNEITPDDIRREGSTVHIRLPEPRLLDFGLVPGSTGTISKATLVPKLMDFSRGGWQRHILERRLQAHAKKFASEHGLMPDREEIARQLNGAAALFREASGVRIHFE